VEVRVRDADDKCPDSTLNGHSSTSDATGSLPPSGIRKIAPREAVADGLDSTTGILNLKG